MCEEGIKKAKDPVFKYILPDICSDAEKEVNPITAEKIVDAIKKKCCDYGSFHT
jgi:hypothetical protein